MVLAGKIDDIALATCDSLGKMMVHFEIRQATALDGEAVSTVIKKAFGAEEGSAIASLVQNLLADPTAQPSLSLVAIAETMIVGHILFSAVKIKEQPDCPAAILAPLAVHPDAQNQGIGGQLIRSGLTQLKTAGFHLVFVLGYPEYYSKYGFTPASALGLTAPYPISPEHTDAWMAQELKPGIFGTVQGEVICADALNEPQYWQE
ncbi:GCN5-related N-acetyltransferase [[Synechococcus] sp. NIES-970]|nr:GCN5-related N-acetyltransferase [[Synechococcus] sp. NIES-970]